MPLRTVASAALVALLESAFFNIAVNRVRTHATPFSSSITDLIFFLALFGFGVLFYINGLIRIFSMIFGVIIFCAIGTLISYGNSTNVPVLFRGAIVETEYAVDVFMLIICGAILIQNRSNLVEDIPWKLNVIALLSILTIVRYLFKTMPDIFLSISIIDYYYTVFALSWGLVLLVLMIILAKLIGAWLRRHNAI